MHLASRQLPADSAAPAQAAPFPKLAKDRFTDAFLDENATSEIDAGQSGHPAATAARAPA
jgi:hypothetical protein